MYKIKLLKVSSLALASLVCGLASAQQNLDLRWQPREDLNILLPLSVRIYEANGILSDKAPVRAMYATIDLRDENLKLRAIGSNTIRETTLETYARHNGILAINGGYFAAKRSESLLISDGELIAPGPSNFTRGAFALINRKPQIIWPFANDSTKESFTVSGPLVLKNGKPDAKGKITPWFPSQAVGAGPVLLKHGKIRDTSLEEGFGGSHLLRHPRSAIGYINEHTIMMMVVDGRQQSSAGVTIKELAQIMLEAGCYEAVNLDGGGSSAMVAADEIVNVPVDIANGNQHSLRRNASALVLTEEIPSALKKIVVIDTDDDRYAETGIWKTTNHVNYYGESPSREALTGKSNKAIYQFDRISKSRYQLAAWWTVSERNSSQASYLLHHGNKVDTIVVDQKSISSNGKWNVLGEFHIGEGDYLEVFGNGDGRFTTDALRLVDLAQVGFEPERGNLRIAVISDLNSGLGSATYEWQVDSIVQRLPRTWKPDLVLCGGDMVAGMGVSDTTTLQKMWRGFDQHIAKPLRDARIPFAFTIGNHDGLRSYTSERAATTAYWSDPHHSTGLRFIDRSHFPDYYSFAQGEAFFISWDASSSEITPENLAWVKQQLKTPDAQKAKFRFIVGHLPLYSVAQERDSRGNLLENADSLRKLLEQHKVTTYISGHQHAYYPGKRGKLQLLNAGAAGSGPRRWLSIDKPPVNTITIMDVFYEKDTIVYTTYDIRHSRAAEMSLLDYRELPSSIEGVNGAIVRNDLPDSRTFIGKFYPSGKQISGRTSGEVRAQIHNQKITFSGIFKTASKASKGKFSVDVRFGKNGEPGKMLYVFPATLKKGTVTFEGSVDLSEGMSELLNAGSYHVVVQSAQHTDLSRAQLYPESNHAPGAPKIISHVKRNTYGIRDIAGLYKFAWTAVTDVDGDRVTYQYQLAGDSLFSNLIINENCRRQTFLKKTEHELWQLLSLKDQQHSTFYQRVLATDGLHVTTGAMQPLHLLGSSEPLTELAELEPDGYAFDGKIEGVTGQGSGALWDKNGKLWLADYGGALHSKLPSGANAAFSPIHQVSVNGTIYPLKPINGIGMDRDGNILVGSNRTLIKINAETGEGIAVWTAPEGKRAITSPRVNDKGEVYAMSLFAEDPNYVLKESTTNPGTFDLLRTINLPQRVLTRTFDMSADGLTLYFPDTGSPLIQVFTSSDGKTYKRSEDITSAAAGCNAIAIAGTKLFAAVRASGVSGSTLHFRDEKEKIMWTLALPELEGSEARGIGVSPDLKTIVICAWDNGGGFYRFKKVK